METQTRFDLNAAIQNWQQELAAQPDLTPDVRRELETHLRDTVAELQRRGLKEEESFWLACRRVGQPQQLGEEFVKTDPANVWRERVLWMAISLVGSYVFMTWKDLLAGWMNQSSWTEFFYLIPLFVFIASVVMIRRGRIPNYLENISSWKLACGLFAILTITVLTAYFRDRNLPGNDLITAGYNISMVLSWLGNAVWPAVMVLILLLTLKRNRKTPKRA
ncbi:MAG TPA: hypothetical protein DCQ92_02515 [Verrucomicrobia subdivision 3 bacterium]|nr:hypothetical protein [Limisphaerales bacterium]